MVKIMQDFNAALKALYDHVGFTEYGVVCPIDDQTDKVWRVDGLTVRYADSKKEFDSRTGNYYEDDVYTQRFYKQWIYRGPELTMIFCDPHVDGVQWFRIFDNQKEHPAGGGDGTD
jgi:hypothetical protein